MTDKKYLDLQRHYESCLEKHGDTHLGVDWPREKDAETRLDVMLGLLGSAAESGASLLDFGCGTSHLYDRMRKRGGFEKVRYTGLDISQKFIDLSKQKYPKNEYICADVLVSPEKLGRYDYAVMNGVFTQKRDMSSAEMFEFVRSVLRAVWPCVEKGMAFNFMSKQVDFEREGSFHLAFETIAEFLTKEISRNFTFRHDYGMYEYTVYVYKNAEANR